MPSIADIPTDELARIVAKYITDIIRRDYLPQYKGRPVVEVEKGADDVLFLGEIIKKQC